MRHQDVSAAKGPHRYGLNAPVQLLAQVPGPFQIQWFCCRVPRHNASTASRQQAKVTGRPWPVPETVAVLWYPGKRECHSSSTRPQVETGRSEAGMAHSGHDRVIHLANAILSVNAKGLTASLLNDRLETLHTGRSLSSEHGHAALSSCTALRVRASANMWAERSQTSPLPPQPLSSPVLGILKAFPEVVRTMAWAGGRESVFPRLRSGCDERLVT